MNRWMAGTSYRALMAADGPTSAPSDPAATAATAPTAAASSSPGSVVITSSSETAPAVTSASTSQSDPGKTADNAPKTESTPSLLAAADAAKREGAPPTETTKTEPAPPPDAKAKPHTGYGKTPEVKPEPGKAPDGTDAAPKEADAKPPPAPVYEAPKLPENVKLDDKLLGAFDKKVGEFELAHKVDHAAMHAFRQEVINDYISEVQRIGQEVAQYQITAWNRLKEQRIAELKADPELGGNRIETVLGNAKYVIEDFGGLTKAEQDQLFQVWDSGGVSEHRLTVKLLNNIFKRFSPPEPVLQNHPAASKLMSEPGKRAWYDRVDTPVSA